MPGQAQIKIRSYKKKRLSFENLFLNGYKFNFFLEKTGLFGLHFW